MRPTFIGGAKMAIYSLGMRIEKARCTREYSQKYMAKTIGVSTSTWSQYESNNREPKLTNFRKIVETLNVSADWLLGLTDDEPRLKEGNK